MTTPRPPTPDAESVHSGFDGKPAASSDTLDDAVFGRITADGPNYRGVSGLGAFVLMFKANIGLGILSLPFVFQTLGLVPGVLVLLVVQTIVCYCARAIGSFKRNHPATYGLPDAGRVFGAPWVHEYLYLFFLVDMVTTVSSAVVSLSAALNGVSGHAACTAVFIAVASVVGLVLGSIRTLEKITSLSWLGVASLLASVLTLTVAVGVSGPAAAPVDWTKEVRAFGSPSFAKAMSAVNSVLFSYSATPCYFNIVSEMADPTQYEKYLYLSTTLLTLLYLVIGILVYVFCGQYVATPALASAGPLMSKVCFGIAIPALVASLVIYAHMSAKPLFVRILAGSRHLASNSAIHWATWLGCMVGTSAVAYVIASAIPNFGNIISLLGALISPNDCIIPYTFMWWHDNWRYKTPSERASRRLRLTLALNVALFFVALFMTVAGTYGAVKDLIDSSSSAGPWSCADNTGSA
ncbi:hypothetical protein VHUM_03011 [Vanrija humicola]|uniref:Amino acid transporter transmembrane domain-containing protein n=1 Tax=Vanrija humicola TaxID=5417 RepID=A0A7D8Z323_VANHU|nr:hypothetical protein VHUM_03011 [Vanrija humicola]